LERRESLARRTQGELATAARAGAHVIIATHSAPFLRLPAEDVEYVRVTRDEAGWTNADVIAGDIIGVVGEPAETLGLVGCVYSVLGRFGCSDP
jgi:hypothetical protein